MLQQEKSGNSRISRSIYRYAEGLKLEAVVGQKIQGITPQIIIKRMCSNNESLGWCMFMQFARISEMSPLPNRTAAEDEPPVLTMEQFEKGSNHFISLITDVEQLSFFIRGFAKGDQIKRSEVQQLIEAAYQLAHLHAPQLCPMVAKTVVDAATHSKESVDIGFLSKWFLKHCHRLVYWMHRHIANIISSSIPHVVEEPQPSSDPIPPPKPLEELSTSRKAPVRKISVDSMLSHRRPSNQQRRLSVPHLTLSKSPSSEKVEMQGSFMKVCEEDSATKPAMHRTVSVPGHTMEAPPPLDQSSLVRSLAHHNSISVLCTLGKEDSELANQDEADADTPVLDHTTSLQTALNPSLMWLLTCSLPVLYTKHSLDPRRPSMPTMSALHCMLRGNGPRHWEPLYMSDRDGLSVNRFEHHVFNYRGPTLALFTASDADVAFCLALDEEWKDSKCFWGGEDCRLLQIRPHYRVLEQGAKMMYFNLNWRGFPTGFQVGGDYQSRAMVVNKELALLQHHNVPYQLGSVEVWGCGPKQIRDNQQDFKQRVQKDVEQRRKVKLPSTEWREHPDRYLLQMAGATTSYANYDTPKPGPS